MFVLSDKRGWWEQVLFPPNSNIEVEGMPRLEMHGSRSIMVLSVRVNVSLKNLTREEVLAALAISELAIDVGPQGDRPRARIQG